MKYFDTILEDQETTISVLYKEQIVRVYSSEVKTIQKLTKTLGKPDTKYKKSKTYWSGASWDISFFESDKLKDILYKETFIDNKVKPRGKEKKNIQKNEEVPAKAAVKKVKAKKKENFEQIQFMF